MLIKVFNDDSVQSMSRAMVELRTVILPWSLQTQGVPLVLNIISNMDKPEKKNCRGARQLAVQHQAGG
jgi:hypothetical protein